MARFARRADLSQKKTGHISESRLAWVTLSKLEAVVFIGDSQEYLDRAAYIPDGYQQVKLTLRTPSRKMPWIINLTHMTVNELDELKKCLDYGFDQARQTCIDLDQRAQEAYDNGDDSWARLYRPDAKFIIRGEDEPLQAKRKPDEGSEDEPINYQRLSEQNGKQRLQSEHGESLPGGLNDGADVGAGEFPLQAGNGAGAGAGPSERIEGGVGNTDS